MQSTRREIEFAPATRKAPAAILAQAQIRFAELAESLIFIPEGSAFWDSMRVSSLYLRVGGWSFRYRITSRAVSVDAVFAP